jgi:hypothetical protein
MQRISKVFTFIKRMTKREKLTLISYSKKSTHPQKIILEALKTSTHLGWSDDIDLRLESIL